MNKELQNRDMFNDIAPKYDFLNHLLSLNIDKIWRRKTAEEILSNNPRTVLDIATGTADLAIIIAQKSSSTSITGLDPAENMLEFGKKKIERQCLNQRITLIQGDALNIPSDDNSFDATSCAFGIRNFADRQKGLDEMWRVLKPGGKACILEFSLPQKTPFRQIYKLYFNKILPKIGRLFSKNKNAYTYLPQSVNDFPSPNKFLSMMRFSGFTSTKVKTLSMGIAMIYTGKKE